MFSTLARVLVVATITACFVTADFTINTPNLVQCQTATVNWKGGNANYLLFIVPSEDVCADSIVDIPQTGENSLQWEVTLAAGSKVDMMVADADGEEAWSGSMVVQPSSDTSCIDQTAMKALIASGSGPANTTLSGSAQNLGSSAAATPTSSLGGYSPVSVAPTVPSGAIGNAGSNPSTVAAASASSGAFPRAALPAGSVFAVAAILFSLAHL